MTNFDSKISEYDKTSEYDSVNSIPSTDNGELWTEYALFSDLTHKEG